MIKNKKTPRIWYNEYIDAPVVGRGKTVTCGMVEFQYTNQFISRHVLGVILLQVFMYEKDAQSIELKLIEKNSKNFIIRDSDKQIIEMDSNFNRSVKMWSRWSRANVMSGVVNFKVERENIDDFVVEINPEMDAEYKNNISQLQETAVPTLNQDRRGIAEALCLKSELQVNAVQNSMIKAL